MRYYQLTFEFENNILRTKKYYVDLDDDRAISIDNKKVFINTSKKDILRWMIDAMRIDTYQWKEGFFIAVEDDEGDVGIINMNKVCSVSLYTEEED